jgi:ADP-heptose:LPS heptosyltransferase
MRFLKTVYLFFFAIITFVFDKCAMFFIGKSVNPSGIAIVRLDTIGDFILWLDAAKEFRNLYPNSKITLVANLTWSSLAALLPYWDEVIPVDRKKITRNPICRLKTLRKIRLLGVALAIQPAFSREYLRGDSLVRASGALKRIGSTGDLNNITSGQKMISDRWYSQLLPETAEPLMELHRNAQFMRSLGLHKFIAGIPSIPKLLDLRERLMIKQPYFIIFPGASWSGRLWPILKFGELLVKLMALNCGAAVLCGSQQERLLCDQVIGASDTEALNLAGETSLPELVEVIRRAKFLVGNETSAIHIAAAVGTPSVSILGGGHYGRFLPYVVESGKNPEPIAVSHKMACFGCNWQCTQPHEHGKALPCISKITVNQVYEEIAKILSTSADKEEAL